MKKKITPVIKSQTRVKSMFAFMHEDNFRQNDGGSIKVVKLDDNSVPESAALNNGDIESTLNEFNSSDQSNEFKGDASNESDYSESLAHGEETIADASVDEINAQDNESNDTANAVTPIVLQRTRGDVTLDKSNKDKKLKGSQEKTYTSSKIVEVESATYDGQPAVAEKVTFKDWWRNLGTKITQSWDRFTQKKGAMRFVVLLGIMVVLIIALLIYTASIRTNFTDLFESPAKAFVMTESDESGVGTLQEFTLKNLTKAQPHSSNTAGFQYIDFYAQDLNKNVDIVSIYFGVCTSSADLTLLISLTIYYGEEEYLSIQDQKTDLSQGVGKGVTLRVNQSIAINSDMHLRLEFKGYKTSEYTAAGTTSSGQKDTSTLSNYDVAFSIYDLQYKS